MININGTFIFDAAQRFPINDPRNHIGCSVIAQLSVALAYPQLTKPAPSYFTYNARK